MTDYTSIPDSDLDQDSPVTQPLMTALRDNPIAIAEAAAGAPIILGAALATADNHPTVTVAAADTYSVEIAITRVNGSQSTTSTSYVVAYTLTNNFLSGSVRFSARHRSSGFPAATSYMRVRKNGVTLNDWSTSSTSNQTRTEDISVVPGDIVTWEHRTTDSGNASNTDYGGTTGNIGFEVIQPIRVITS